MDQKSQSTFFSKATFKKAFLYMMRVVGLRCPSCGKSPIFVSVRKVRSLTDWFQPLDGCPRCGFAYEREPGYFLMAIWAVNYGIMALFGVGWYWMVRHFLKLEFEQRMVISLLPIPFVAVAIARHAKALFIAFDHFFDPHLSSVDHKND